MPERKLPLSLDDLPAAIPVFPLNGAILLPRCRLPLNVFEPRYLNMVDDALAGDRMIGIIQPTQRDGATPRLYAIGCAGRLTHFDETPDGRYEIALGGVCRFAIQREENVEKPYRAVSCDWSRFEGDLTPESDSDIDLTALMTTLKSYLASEDLEADWPSIKTSKAEALINSLSMICPFEPDEKQALLEAPRLSDRLEALIALMRLSSAAGRGNDRMQ